MITTHEGSVQHLDFLTDDEKDVFKTAFELDQRWIVELAGDRAEYVCQSQSVNIFLPADVHKKMLHEIHWQAWKKGMKTLYYCRSKSIQRADVVSSKSDVYIHNPQPVDGETMPVPDPAEVQIPLAAAPVNAAAAAADGSGNDNDYEECLACQ